MAEPSPRGPLSSRLLQYSAHIQASFKYQSINDEIIDNNITPPILTTPNPKRKAICITPPVKKNKEPNEDTPVLVNVSKLQVQAIYGGSLGFYTIVLTTQCSSAVVVHLMIQSDRSRAVRITTSRICFTPKTYHIPQVVGVHAVDITHDTVSVVHRVYSQDERFDQAIVPSVQVNVMGNEASYVWSFGGDPVLHQQQSSSGVSMATPYLVTGFAAACQQPIGTGEVQSTMLNVIKHLREDQDIYFSSLGCGDNFTVAVSSQSCLTYVFGQGTMGTIGDHSCASTKTPLLLNPSIFATPQEKPAIVSLSCGQHHVAVISRGGHVFTWGSGRLGQLGHKNYLDLQHPKRIQLDPPEKQLREAADAVIVAKYVACGGQHTLVITDLQQVLAFGNNKAGQLGLGHRNCRTESGWRSCVPTVISSLAMYSVHQVAAGLHHSACITTQGELYTWGCGIDGRLGNNSSTAQDIPTVVYGLKTLGVVPKVVRCGGRHTCILTSTDELYTWGANDFGQLGLGHTRQRTTPALVSFPKPSRILDVSLGQFHSAAVAATGDVYTWGYDVNGGLGLPDTLGIQSSPVLVPAFTGLEAVQIQCGWSHTTVLTRRKTAAKKVIIPEKPIKLPLKQRAITGESGVNLFQTLQALAMCQNPSRPKSARPYHRTPRPVESEKVRRSVQAFHDRMARVRPQSARSYKPPQLTKLAPKPPKKAIRKSSRPSTAPLKTTPRSPSANRDANKSVRPLVKRPQSARGSSIFRKQCTPRFPPPMTPRELKTMTHTVLHQLEQLTPNDDEKVVDNNNNEATTSRWTFLTDCAIPAMDETSRTKKTPKQRPRSASCRVHRPSSVVLDQIGLRSKWKEKPIESVLKAKQYRDQPRLWLH
ncbi:hypothetical protein THRCLA_11473 [Thraustotheca clavata]|uniref:RCC1-like domain-containing protein n=1 Tax=Thraustotheca clavata TaxID=74557 RepID=A0A1V9Y7N6_9STRA|nr:hypothetical protein THRCLA_11473 [Thraustotheca clavata]